jgi:hypothetical protein
MKISIIKGHVELDQSVSKDNLGVFGVDFSGVASDLWALNWDSVTKTGEIEWATGPVPNQSVTSEAEIDSALGGVTLQTMLDRRQARLDEEQAEQDAFSEKIVLEEQAVRDAAAAAAGPPPPEWMQHRIMEFPSAAEQLDMVYEDNLNGTTTHKDALEAVKDKWPKDDSGPIE